MKLDEHSLCFEVMNEDYIKHHLYYCNKKIKLFDDNELFKKRDDLIIKENFFSNKRDFRTLVFSKKSKLNLEHYKIPKDIRVEVLRTLPNRNDIILIDTLNCIKYVKTDTHLWVTFNYREKEITPTNLLEKTYMFYFHIDLVSGEIITDEYEYQHNTFIKKEEIIERFYGRFLQVVTYLELTDVTLNVIMGKSKGGDIMKNNNIKNTSLYKVIQVNTNWNVETISLNSFEVRGHWRLQPYGVGRMFYKFIWINPFEKGLIHKLPQKEHV
jgi:hypothetical protein